MTMNKFVSVKYRNPVESKFAYFLVEPVGTMDGVDYHLYGVYKDKNKKKFHINTFVILEDAGDFLSELFGVKVETLN